MSGEACGLWVDVWMSILCEELPRLGRAIASIGAPEQNRLTDCERQLVRRVSESAMLLNQPSLETTQSVPETEFYEQMLANAERIRQQTRRAAREIERIVAARRVVT
jgi:hypothetical protein